MTATLEQLDAIASEAVTVARRGAPIPDLSAVTVPPVMRTSPVNEVGAYYRNAYWLALASRIAHSQSWYAASTLSLNARANLIKAQAAAKTSWKSGSVEAIRRILMEAIKGTDGREIYPVSAELRRLQVPAAIQAAQAAYTAETGRDPGGMLPTLPDRGDLDAFQAGLFERFFAALKAALLTQGLVFAGVLAAAGTVWWFVKRRRAAA